MPQNLSLHLPDKLKEELEPILTNIKLMIEMNEQQLDKAEVIQCTMERLGTEVLCNLPEKV